MYLLLRDSIVCTNRDTDRVSFVLGFSIQIFIIQIINIIGFSSGFSLKVPILFCENPELKGIL